MITDMIMLCITCILLAVLFLGVQKQTNGEHFFDLNNSNALRGFWCLIVVLVHIPVMYQNRIQDMIGSFAYVGVTFFFMTSAYGLRLQMCNEPERIKSFWRKRLPKLLIPCFITNILNVAIKMISGKTFDFSDLIKINPWVGVLFVLYLFFWINYSWQKSGGAEAVLRHC